MGIGRRGRGRVGAACFSRQRSSRLRRWHCLFQWRRTSCLTSPHNPMRRPAHLRRRHRRHHNHHGPLHRTGEHAALPAEPAAGLYTACGPLGTTTESAKGLPPRRRGVCRPPTTRGGSPRARRRVRLGQRSRFFNPHRGGSGRARHGGARAGRGVGPRRSGRVAGHARPGQRRATALSEQRIRRGAVHVRRHVRRAARPWAVAELAKVTRLSLAIPGGFMGELLAIHATHVPPPAGPAGSRALGRSGRGPRVVRRRAMGGSPANVGPLCMRYPHSPEGSAKLFPVLFGPTVQALEVLEADRRATLAADLIAHWTGHRRGRAPRGTEVEAEFLELVAVRTRPGYRLRRSQHWEWRGRAPAPRMHHQLLRHARHRLPSRRPRHTDPDELIPGTLNMGHTPPTIVQSIMYITS